MEATLDEAPFVDFGDDSLYPYRAPGMRRIEGESRIDLRAQVKQFVPRVPGVYGMLDPLGRLIYVGKSKCLRNRLISYFLPNNEEDKQDGLSNRLRPLFGRVNRVTSRLGCANRR